MDKEIEMNTSIDILLTSDLDPSFSQSFCVGPRPVFREITDEERSVDTEEVMQNNISAWSTDLSEFPPTTQESIHQYLIIGKSFDNQPRGVIKHKISGYQIFKEGYVKKIRVKANVKLEKLSFIVKCFVTASMKKVRYTVYVHLCQTSGEMFYGKCNCKAGAGGCCKHVAAVLYQLVEYRQLGLKTVPEDKTCTDVLQKWHIPGEGSNSNPIKFSELRFEKADINKDQAGSRKRPFVSGSRDFCATPPFAHTASQEKIKKLCSGLLALGQGTVLANILKGNDYAPSSFYETSITKYKNKTEKHDDTCLRPMVAKLLKKLDGNVVLNLISEDHLGFVKTHLNISNSDIIRIESKTSLQSHSND